MPAKPPPLEHPVVVTPPLAVEHTAVPALVEIVAALASPASVPTMAFEEVTVEDVAAIGTCVAVMPDKPLPPELQLASAPPFREQSKVCVTESARR